MIEMTRAAEILGVDPQDLGHMTCLVHRPLQPRVSFLDLILVKCVQEMLDQNPDDLVADFIRSQVKEAEKLLYQFKKPLKDLCLFFSTSSLGVILTNGTLLIGGEKLVRVQINPLREKCFEILGELPGRILVQQSEEACLDPLQQWASQMDLIEKLPE